MTDAINTAQHVDYPHEPGRLYDCTACESQCYCVAEEEPCVYCANGGE